MSSAKQKNDNFLILTGLSGSGKTVVSHFFEDMGYYRIDNLPAKLIPYLVDFWKTREVEIQKIVLVVDIREAGFLKDFPQALEKIKEVVTPKIIFLEARDEILIKRYSESRRPHPLKTKRSMLEKIALERERLAQIREMADEIIDTSDYTVAELRKKLTERYFRRRKHRLQVLVVSFGYKFGLPLESDLVLDTRFLPNPFYLENLKELTGRSQKVRGFVLESTETKEYLKKIFQMLEFLMPRFISEGKSNLTISIGCTGGKHRSVVVATEIYRWLKSRKFNVRIFHRDIYK
ncbi:MAG: RNase adapter RapZ [Candidatus Aminicenantes bacterium]|nr:RNase adapter RapZ [Candidatus Aminicenantes bacterium]OQX54789.1 MAG: RNase adaptor protein RapZ [Candidatus Aminicenantes bacterium 4484_214]RLE02944.1 MAG: RNase adapter RapZ [Candidatus Aminicenantes bacterium]